VWQGFVAKNTGGHWSLIRKLATAAGTYTQSVSAVERTTAPHRTTHKKIIINLNILFEGRGIPNQFITAYGARCQTTETTATSIPDKFWRGVNAMHS